jgi:CheY-like chemotaxis protein
MALRSLEPSDPLRQDLEEIRRAGDRAARLTRQLLAFSRRQLLEMRVLNLNEVLEGLGKMLPRLIGEDIRLAMKLAPDLGYTRADPGQIEQAVVNLVVNARDAMPDGGQLTIATSNVTLAETLIGGKADLPAGEYVMLAISDTGMGMTEEVKAHLFEPFYTTKEAGKGTGLGLATVYGIVKQHQGNIWAYSEPGQGTTFVIYLPRVTEEARPLSRPAESRELPRGSETVLVAEDEAAVRGIAVRVLGSLGYTVLEATNGGEALAVAQKAWAGDPPPPDRRRHARGQRQSPGRAALDAPPGPQGALCLRLHR